MAETEKPSPFLAANAVYDPSLELAVELVAAYVANNPLPASGLPGLIHSVRTELAKDLPTPTAPSVPTHASPAMEKPSDAEIKKSIAPDALISFIDGRPYKTLKRHLTTHGLTPKGYRDRFGLPGSYPMTAPNYSAARSELARAAGLGRGGPAPEAERSPNADNTAPADEFIAA